jgi:hypothetical protein
MMTRDLMMNCEFFAIMLTVFEFLKKVRIPDTRELGVQSALLFILSFRPGPEVPSCEFLTMGFTVLEFLRKVYTPDICELGLQSALLLILSFSLRTIVGLGPPVVAEMIACLTLGFFARGALVLVLAYLTVVLLSWGGPQALLVPLTLFWVGLFSGYFTL